MLKLYIKDNESFKWLMFIVAVVTAITLITLFSIKYSFLMVCIVLFGVSCIAELIALIIAGIYGLILLITRAIGIRK